MGIAMEECRDAFQDACYMARGPAGGFLEMDLDCPAEECPCTLRGGGRGLHFGDAWTIDAEVSLPAPDCRGATLVVPGQGDLDFTVEPDGATIVDGGGTEISLTRCCESTPDCPIGVTGNVCYQARQERENIRLDVLCSQEGDACRCTVSGDGRGVHGSGDWRFPESEVGPGCAVTIDSPDLDFDVRLVASGAGATSTRVGNASGVSLTRVSPCP
jgi:hypothetical protein